MTAPTPPQPVCIDCGRWSEYPDGHHPLCASRPRPALSTAPTPLPGDTGVWPDPAWTAETAERCTTEGHHAACRRATCPAAPSEPPVECTCAPDICDEGNGGCVLCNTMDGELPCPNEPPAETQQDDERERVADLVSELLRGQAVGSDRVRSDEARRMANHVAGPLVDLHHRCPATQPSADTETLARVRLESAAEALEKLTAWAWARDGFLAGAALEITEHAQTTAAFIRKMAEPESEANR